MRKRRAREADLTVANEILRQMGGAGRLGAMLGAKNFVGGADSLSFQWPGKPGPIPGKRANAINITLDPSDTYTITFYNVVKGVPKVVETFHDIYADQLVELFEKFTGLYLRF